MARNVPDDLSVKLPFCRLIGWVRKESAECRLHPLIHTLLLVSLAQSIVAWPQEQKCGLKYVI
jgi:hypothetical protein